MDLADGLKAGLAMPCQHRFGQCGVAGLRAGGAGLRDPGFDPAFVRLRQQQFADGFAQRGVGATPKPSAATTIQAAEEQIDDRPDQRRP
jgi:hypothetical protein